MKPEKILYTAHATSKGGRDGGSRSDDGALDVRLTVPKGLGGNGAPGTNPEQLFAAGYSACFLGAMQHVARAQKLELPSDTSIDADVGIGPIPQGFAILKSIFPSDELGKAFAMFGPVMGLSAVAGPILAGAIVGGLALGFAGNATSLLLYYIFEIGFRFWDSAYAAALTMVLLTLLATVAILQFAFLERRTHYQ